MVNSAIVPVLFSLARFAASSLDVPLFDWEKQQLTDDDLDKLDPNIRPKLGFDEDPTQPLPQKGDCRAFPGDEDWPSQNDWEAFNNTLGGALISTVPVAAPCYKEWGVYDGEECARILDSWSDPYFQYESRRCFIFLRRRLICTVKRIRRPTCFRCIRAALVFLERLLVVTARWDRIHHTW
jgi:hypothetical protein